MIVLAIEYRQAEKNTPPVWSRVSRFLRTAEAFLGVFGQDFTTNPPLLRNSVFCQRAPKNPQLTGLVQAQDPANDPNLFFDPALDATVHRGSQANTFPFSGAAASCVIMYCNLLIPVFNFALSGLAVNATSTMAPTMIAGGGTTDALPTAPCVASFFLFHVRRFLWITWRQTVITVTVSVANPTTTGTNPMTINPSSTITNAPSTPTGNIGNFGKCSIPEIEFGTGFDGRKETSFQPVDKSQSRSVHFPTC